VAKIKSMIHFSNLKRRKTQVTSYLIGMVPIVKVAYFGSGGGNANSRLPIIKVFI
jgi:hypothetical protein